MVTTGAIPCNPDWPIFTRHGVRYVPFTGPKELGIMSYEWDSFNKTIIPQVIQKWLPREELGKYADVAPNPKHGQTTIQLKCGTKIHMFAMSQGQASVESQALDHVLWDEQGSEDKFKGNEGQGFAETSAAW